MALGWGCVVRDGVFGTCAEGQYELCRLWPVCVILDRVLMYLVAFRASIE
jgi:hypothetical protein